MSQCRHIWHSSCILDFLQQNGSNRNCPDCRSGLTKIKIFLKPSYPVREALELMEEALGGPENSGSDEMVDAIQREADHPVSSLQRCLFLCNSPCCYRSAFILFVTGIIIILGNCEKAGCRQ